MRMNALGTNSPAKRGGGTLNPIRSAPPAAAPACRNARRDTPRVIAVDSRAPIEHREVPRPVREDQTWQSPDGGEDGTPEQSGGEELEGMRRRGDVSQREQQGRDEDSGSRPASERLQAVDQIGAENDFFVERRGEQVGGVEDARRLGRRIAGPALEPDRVPEPTG